MLFDEVLKAATTGEANKLTHQQVDYQDRPRGDEQCDRCWKFLRAIAPQSSQALEDHLVASLGFSVIHPACMKVQSPISPTGWCKNFERQATVGVEAAPGAAPRVVAKQLSFLDALLMGTTAAAAPVAKGKAGTAVSFHEAMAKWNSGEPRDKKGKWRGRRRTKKAFNPDQARDTQGKWTAVEDAVSTAKDLQRIMDKANLDRAHGSVSPETDRNIRRLSTSNLQEWTDGPIDLVQDAKDFKPGDEHHDSLTPEQRDQHQQQLNEDLEGVREEIQGHTDKLAAGLAAYSRDVNAYANRVSNTLRAVNERTGKTSKGFDPSEPRDNKGEWTSGGGSVSGGSAAAGFNQKPTTLTGEFLQRHVTQQQAVVREKQDRVTALRQQLSRTSSSASEDHYWGIHQELAIANSDLREAQLELKNREEERDRPAVSILSAVAGLDLSRAYKSFDPGQARDDRGRWISADGSPLAMHSSDAEDIANLVAPHEEGLGDKLGDVNQASEKLANVAEQTADAEATGDNHEEDHGERNQALDDATVEHQAAAAKAAIQLHGRLQALVDAATSARDDVAGAMREAGLQRVSKAFNPDEARDSHGMWTTGGDAPAPDYIDGHEGEELHNKVDDLASKVSDHSDKINEANNKLLEASSHHQDVSAEEPEREGLGGKEWDKWSVENDKAGAAVADAAMEVRQALIDHAHYTAKQIEELDADLAQHEEDYGRRVGKNITVGDVHASTALGNQAPRKAKDFLTTIAELKDGARIVQLPAPADAVGKIERELLGYSVERILVPVGKNGRMMEILLLRHGPTRFNNQTDMSKDRVRSWNDVDLTEEGREAAQKAGEKLAKELDGRTPVIISSDLKRAVETSNIVGKEVGAKAIHTPLMRPWNLGKFTGQTTAESYDGILSYVDDKPDETVPDGESFNDFTHRFVKGVRWAIKKAGRKPLVLVSHHRNERWLAAWIKAGMPSDLHVDPKEFMKTGEDPGDIATFEIDLGKLGEPADDQDPVKKVWGSNEDLPDSVKGNLPDHAQTVFRTVANDRIKNGASEVSAIRQAWTAVKNGWRKTKGGQWVRKASDFASVMKDNFVGDDDGTASLILNNLGDGSAKTPFPYDQNAFANLRDDQKERFLSALTDPDQLPVKTVRLCDLSSIQDRVDPDKVQSMRDTFPEKLPTVLRMGPGRYVIADGHHRLSAMFLDGCKTAMVRYMDLERVDNRVYADGNPGSGGEDNGDGDRPESAIPRTKKRNNDDWNQEFTVAKVDQDKQLVFGWASISEMDGQLVIDKQDDIILPDDLETAVYDYVLYHRQQGDMHERMGVGRMVESMVFTKEKQEAIGCDLGLVGWWIGFKVDDPGVWTRIKNGDLPEFSIGGKAIREEIEA